jgi:hypothetical protein
MNLFKKEIPALINLGLMVAGFVAQNQGVLTADQLAMVLVVLGVGGTGVAHRMDRKK